MFTNLRAIALLSVLVLLTGGLAIVTVTQAPGVMSVSVNAQSATERPGQLLVLTLNRAPQPLTEADVTVTPAVAFTARSEANRLEVQFAEALDYHTEYTVEVGVAGLDNGAHTTLTERFTTPKASVVTLVHAADSPDRLLQHTLDPAKGVVGIGAEHSEVVFEHPQIEDYAVLSDRIVAVTLVDGGGVQPVLIDPATGAGEPLSSEPWPSLTGLQADAQTMTIGYLVGAVSDDSSPGHGLPKALLLQNLAAGTSLPRQVTAGLGESGEPIGIARWAMLPKFSAVAVERDDGAVYVVPLEHTFEAKAEPLLVSRDASVLGVSPAGTELMIEHDGHTVSIDLEAMLDGSHEGATSASLPERELRQRFEAQHPEARVGEICMSSNDRLAAIELGAARDGQTTTVIVDARDAQQRASVLGGKPGWCR
ncbi:hypothetical protein JSO19_11050 [Leucobacter sp. UCMA 4100]|uniref:Ig-like domain-containing protein n=1 Tax=Leucobacter sp. UCMA 4100 TaxID=2810534 RepID=UPI0022EAEA28|nr:Ig-like domain-containing protein [Leucobacter sp. UCMA 4100]MDA3147913.1 hypothetical protein [Leucobacter sp. UCMA 4100]